MVKQSTPNTTFATIDASRRLAEETTAAARKTAERGMTMSRNFVEAWAASAEITLKASFDLQNAAINAGNSLIETMDGNTKATFQQWTDMVHQAQQATLDAWHASQRIGEQFRAGKPEGPDGP